MEALITKFRTEQFKVRKLGAHPCLLSLDQQETMGRKWDRLMRLRNSPDGITPLPLSDALGSSMNETHRWNFTRTSFPDYVSAAQYVEMSVMSRLVKVYQSRKIYICPRPPQVSWARVIALFDMHFLEMAARVNLDMIEEHLPILFASLERGIVSVQSMSNPYASQMLYGYITLTIAPDGSNQFPKIGILFFQPPFDSNGDQENLRMAFLTQRGLTIVEAPAFIMFSSLRSKLITEANSHHCNWVRIALIRGQNVAGAVYPCDWTVPGIRYKEMPPSTVKPVIEATLSFAKGQTVALYAEFRVVSNDKEEERPTG